MPKLSASVHREPTAVIEGEDEDTDTEAGSWVADIGGDETFESSESSEDDESS
jgi:hypothetical protein